MMRYEVHINGRYRGCAMKYPDDMPVHIREWAIHELVIRMTAKGYPTQFDGNKFIVTYGKTKH